jgi:hypothetical protein
MEYDWQDSESQAMLNEKNWQTTETAGAEPQASSQANHSSDRDQWSRSHPSNILYIMVRIFETNLHIVSPNIWFMFQSNPGWWCTYPSEK